MENEIKNNPKRRMRTKAERRRIVEETLMAGASVSRVARSHDVNANQVFNWRRLYRAGQLETESSSPSLLPIKITGPVERPQRVSRKAVRRNRSGTIDIDLGHARVRIEGAADPASIRATLEGLSR
jgi:transposase